MEQPTGRLDPDTIHSTSVGADAPGEPACGAPPFEIVTDVARRYLRLTVRGEWTPEICDAYCDAFRSAIRAMNAQNGVAYVLTDATGYGLLTTEMNERMAALVREDTRSLTWRNAIVTRSVLNQAQVRADCAEDGARFFRTVEAAEAWLFSDEA